MNGNLTDQRFKTLKPIHNGYSPGAMSFHYYDDLNIKDYFLKHLNNDYENLPAPKLIKNLETFNDFNNLYCIWIGQDHNIYRITEPDPMPSIRRYIINSNNWNLKSIQKHLKSNKNVIEVKIIDNYFKDL